MHLQGRQLVVEHYDSEGNKKENLANDYRCDCAVRSTAVSLAISGIPYWAFTSS
jgi:hypothetical protein